MKRWPPAPRKRLPGRLPSNKQHNRNRTAAFWQPSGFGFPFRIKKLQLQKNDHRIFRGAAWNFVKIYKKTDMNIFHFTN